MQAIAVIAFNTFRESVRDKIFYNLLFFAVLLIGGSILLADLTIMEHHKIIKDMGLAAINLVGVLVAIFVGIGLVSKEIERRTVYAIMARPIHRAQFALGKYVGLIGILLFNVLVMSMIYVLVLWLYRIPIQGAIFQAIQLIFVEVSLVTALALLFSTFSSSTLSAVMTTGLYIVGHLTGDLRDVAIKSSSSMLKTIVHAIYYVCPNLEMFNIKGQAAMGVAVSASYMVTATAYGLLYVGVLLATACVIFEQRDF
jgi:Cu-processing system permease protein